ncbi:hypothetical protein H310_04372 [Aphanomyces invadans]|uniref:Tyrosine-protein kinase ephrin type A/B receptor-like domain-containing protein n=1 Tax=Aphanomyces invadans TaxID=157072 RepID=A0A024UCP5_9STRA|nr:hypothetical protein H310_04372 [Aphanomyces invadans]ETW03965.1 hypothetical protein H310_04372 [Aphanomyces invadans]|eukprot:XP_008866921.1 hypothetical protein H310_04372 [Aphanomyces invadans]
MHAAIVWTSLATGVVHSCAVLGYYKPPPDQTMLPVADAPCAGHAPCPKGSYCRNNQALPCLGGFYGNATQLYSPSCSGICPGGHACPPGTVTPIPCGHANVYCPVGSRAPKPIPPGYYGIGDTALTRQSIQLCALGSFCVEGTMATCLAGTFGASKGLASSECTDVCPPGHYCPEASIAPIPCPPGTYGDTTQLTTAACTGICPEGFYCPSGTATPKPCPSNSICPSGSTAPTIIPHGQYLTTIHATTTTFESMLTTCPPGSYCINGLVTPCPLGRYGNATGLTTALCSGPCPEGFYCPVGTETPIACLDPSTYCPIESSKPQVVSLGYYSLPTASPTRSLQLPCDPGSYCANGVKTKCPAGSFGITLGLTSSSCSGTCPAGSYCPAGTVEPLPCGHPSVMCPEGSAAPQAIASGFCGVGQTVLTQTSSVVAPSGSYALEGQCYICPGGYFGASSGQTSLTCSGLCAAGYYCPSGSTSATQVACGLNAYCPEGSDVPTPVLPGSFTVSAATDPCPPGQYRATAWSNSNILLASWSAIQVNYGDALYPFAACIACPIGTYKAVDGDSVSLCQLCTMYTTTSSSDRTTCDCFRLSGGATWNETTHKLVFDGSACLAVPAATLTPSWLPPNTAFTQSSQSQCTRGAYCVRGQRFPCPGGRFGTLAKETNPLCTGLCRRGHFCPVGSTSNTAQPCGGPHLYCPEGSPYPLPVTAGFYSIDSALGLASDPARRDTQAACEPGFYCLYGQRYPCPGGRYGSATGETNPLCTGLCRRGFYCPLGSTSATQVPCGGPNVVCRTGSDNPIAVSPGYYSGSDTTRADAVSRETMRWFQKPCEPGYYCVNGVRSPCPRGTFGSGGQLTTPSCSGACAAGYYCPEASTSATPFLCGNVAFFCPAGSSEPLAVAAGYYTAGGTNSTRVRQEECGVGQFCQGGIAYDCPQGTYGDTTGLTVEQCSGWCAAGFFCPPRSASATANRCPDGYYSIRGQGSCMQCPTNRPITRCQDKRECCA